MERDRAHNRRSHRLRGYDYGRAGAYFITLCTKDRQPLFGEVIGGKMRWTRAGDIVADEWLKSAAVRVEIDMDAFVIMPNHIHGIIVIDTTRVGRGDRPVAPTHNDATTTRNTMTTTHNDASGPKPRSIGAFIAGFKSAATKRINEMRGTPGMPVWQRNFHDHIIRNADEMERIRRYIAANPRNWAMDRENPNGDGFEGEEDWET